MRFVVLSLLLITCIFVLSVGAATDGKEKMNKYYKRTGQKYLDMVAKSEHVIKLKSGMLVEILKSGSDVSAKSPNLSDE